MPSGGGGVKIQIQHFKNDIFLKDEELSGERSWPKAAKRSKVQPSVKANLGV